MKRTVAMLAVAMLAITLDGCHLFHRDCCRKPSPCCTPEPSCTPAPYLTAPAPYGGAPGTYGPANVAPTSPLPPVG